MKKIRPDALDKMTDEELLPLRFRELDIKIEGTWLESCIDQLYKELSERGIILRPPCYLADEWLCPDKEPVIGIAFYLAHPRLRKLEQKMMLEVEGGDNPSCMRLLRHEMGHVINYAHQLYRRKKWRDLFGPFSAEYGDSYKYRPYSKRFVRHLDEWYAQYHPDEDFAETFAVWLDPESNWREKYKGWGAQKKLAYIDDLMQEIAGKSPKKSKGDKYWDVSKMKTTLKTHYKKRRATYAASYSDFHDFTLKKIFPEVEGKTKRKKAHQLLRQHRKEILNHVASWTGEKKYMVNNLLRDLTKRCKELELEAGPDETDAVLKVAVYVTAQVMNYIYTGGYEEKR